MVVIRNVARAIETVTSGDRRLRPFLRRHRAELELFIGSGRIDWTPVRLLVRELGLHDASGKAPTKSAIARAWRAVCLEGEAKPPPVSEPVPASSLAAGVRLAADQPKGVVVRPADGSGAFEPQASVPARPVGAIAPSGADRAPTSVSGTPGGEAVSDAMRRAIERVTLRPVPRPIDT